MKITRLSPSAWSFLGDVALDWGTDWSGKLREEMGKGTFSHLDDEPCRVIVEQSGPKRINPAYQQGRLL